MSTKQEDTTAMLDTAESFFDACESGKGWDACRPYCHPEAAFSAQAGAAKRHRNRRRIYRVDGGAI